MSTTPQVAEILVQRAEEALWNSQRTDHDRVAGGRPVRTNLSPCCHFDFREQCSEFLTLVEKKDRVCRWPLVGSRRWIRHLFVTREREGRFCFAVLSIGSTCESSAQGDATPHEL